MNNEPAPIFTGFQGHPLEARFARDKEAWEPLGPDCNGEPDNEVYALQAVRFACSGFYEIPRRPSGLSGAALAAHDLACIPAAQQAIIHRYPLQAWKLARAVCKEYADRYHLRGNGWTRQQARDVLFTRLDDMAAAGGRMDS